MTPRRTATALALLLVLAGVAGCASVPESSPVQVLRQISEGDVVAAPPGPADNSNPLDLVRDFVNASGSSTDKHGAARRFLTPQAQTWDDGASLTVIDAQFDSVPVPLSPAMPPGVRDSEPDSATTIRIRGTKLGRVLSSGSFEPEQAAFQLDVGVIRLDGQWRISSLPSGAVISLPVFQNNYRAVRTWFVDPVRRLAVADLRYVPGVPARAQAARVLELLLAGPSGSLRDAAISQLTPGARLRSNAAVSPDGALVVDLTRVKIDDLDEPARRLLAAQVVMSLAEVNIARTRLLVDGEPLLPGKSDWTREDVATLSAEVQPGADVPALVVTAGKVEQLGGPQPLTPLPGVAGSGAIAAASAALTVDGRRLAVVARTGAGATLLVGGIDGGLAPVALNARAMTRPSWTPTGGEVWTVLDSAVVARVLVDNAGAVRTGQVNADELAAIGPIRDLRLSRDGMRLAAVVGGGLYTAAIARNDGEVAIRNVRRLRPFDLGEAVAADWRSGESIVAITRGAKQFVAQVKVDGSEVLPVLSNNLTSPLTAITAAPNRPLMVTDQVGVWSFAGGEQGAWRQMVGGAPDAMPLYPG